MQRRPRSAHERVRCVDRWRCVGLLIAALCALALLASACSASVQIDDTRASPDTSDQVDAGVPTDPLGPVTAEVYTDIADSIVFVEAGDATGTGIVIEGGWVLTNAHVVERLPKVRLGSFDGSDLGMHDVFATDWLFDLALVGPLLDSPLDAFERVPSSDLAIGDGVMLVGFPDESNAAPTPTLTSGIVSRRRQPALGDYPFLQVDATIAPGQSGGALIDLDGNLVGISGLEFGEGEFGLVFEADAMWPRIDRLIDRGQMASLPTTNPVFRLSDEAGPRRTMGFVMEVDSSGAVQLLVQGDDDLYIDVRTLTGSTYIEYPRLSDPFIVPFDAGETVYFVDELLDGGEELSGELPPGIYEVVIGSFGEQAAAVNVTSDNALRPYADAEESAELPIGELVEGEIDWSGDSDRWQLSLEAGDEVTITTDGIADTLFAVRLDGEAIAASDDEFLGLFGTAATTSFVAPETAVYEVEVGSFDVPRWGYLIEVLVG